jgi:hypothetical protein
MNSCYVQFNDHAIRSGLLQMRPGVAQQLKQVTENFVSLAKSAAEGREGDEDGSDSMPDTLPEGQSALPPAETTQETHRQVWGYTITEEVPLGPSTNGTQGQTQDLPDEQANAEKVRQTGLVRIVGRPHVTIGHLMDQGGAPWNEPTLEERDPHQGLPFGLVELPSRQQHSTQGQPYSVSIPAPDVSSPYIRLPTPRQPSSLSFRNPAPTWTYSHDETTFARRLTRASLETGFHLLSMASQRPAALNHVFRLSLPFLTQDELRERFKMLLARGVTEDLNYWDTPFIHLGGAGTHYQRKDQYGNIIREPNAWTIRPIGPASSKVVRAENVADPSRAQYLDVDLTGYEGEWFDAWDVEGYLEHEKGVRIDPKDSFAEVSIDDDFVPGKFNDINERIDARDQFGYSRTRRSESNTPSFDTGTNSTPGSISPPTQASHVDMDTMYGQSDEPFGLDMGSELNSNLAPADFGKFPEIDSSTFFDQPLGLDLAPGFDLPYSMSQHNMLPPLSYDSESVDLGPLGLDMVGGETPSIPVFKQKAKKAAWLDVGKLIQSKWSCIDS